MNLSINRINPVGLRILSLRGCTAACIVKVGFEGSRGKVGWVEVLGLDHESEVKACCMLCLSGYVGVFLGGCCVVLHALLTISVAWLWATSSLPAVCRALWMLADALRLPHTWLWACPTLTHTQKHEHVHNPTAIVLPCLLSLVPNAHVRR